MRTGNNNSLISKIFTFKTLSKCMVGGIGGFFLIFMVIITAKLFGFILNTYHSFKFDSEDFMLSMIGFVLVFIIKFLEQVSDPEDKKGG